MRRGCVGALPRVPLCGVRPDGYPAFSSFPDPVLVRDAAHGN
ncbi:hypothetical protein GJR88_03770 [Dietzia sp. DQ12-45-1b]|nr:hypothetical protein GJR88_03770 [Dietzia sp. DQ12-45-1b]